jgi:hypothetical protein
MLGSGTDNAMLEDRLERKIKKSHLCNRDDNSPKSYSAPQHIPQFIRVIHGSSWHHVVAIVEWIHLPCHFWPSVSRELPGSRLCKERWICQSYIVK